MVSGHHQRSSEVIRGHQRLSSEVIRGHWRSSEAIIRVHNLINKCVTVGAYPQSHLHIEIHRDISRYTHASMHISGKLEVISGHQRSLVAITCSRNACKHAIGPLRLSDCMVATTATHASSSAPATALASRSGRSRSVESTAARAADSIAAATADSRAVHACGEQRGAVVSTCMLGWPRLASRACLKRLALLLLLGFRVELWGMVVGGDSGGVGEA